MKKLFITILLATLSAGLTFADGGSTSKKNTETEVSGIVVDSESGEVLTGVKVHIPEINKETYTDFDGKFSFSVDNGSNLTIQASYLSYHDKTLSSGSQTNKNIKLELESIDN